jgi:hypothetical protein
MGRMVSSILITFGLGAGLVGAADAQTYFGGTIAVYITTQLATSTITSVTCEASVTNTNDSSGHINSEQGTVAGTIGTVQAGVGNCAVIIPYLWLLSSQSTDTFDVTYSVIGTGPGETRTTTHTLATGVAVPADGVGTGFSATTRL